MSNESRSAVSRICVFGAGAVGSYVAGRLAHGGAAVSIVARGVQLSAIRAQGLSVLAPDRDVHVQVTASDDPAELGPQDAVFITVKAPALSSVAAAIAPLLGPSTPIVFLMNGIPWWYFHPSSAAPRSVVVPLLDEIAAAWVDLGTERAIGGVSYPACTVTEPGTVRVFNPDKGLILGEPDGAVSERITMLAGALRAGGVPVEITPRIRESVWAKVVNNLASGPMSILAQCAARELYERPASLDAVRRSREEAAAIANAMGCDVAAAANAMVSAFRSVDHKSSIVQDLERGRAMEIDALYTIPLAMARQLGVATPTLDLLVELVKLRARSAGLYAG
jgi:2-dehydropantoate 2-reductase